MEEDEEFKFTCHECGKSFDPDPDTVHEVFMAALDPKDILPPEQVSEMLGCGSAITEADFRELDSEQLAEMGITCEERDAILAGREVTVGGICICQQCMDRLVDEQTKDEEE